jgi:hypothetical protein
MAHPETHPSALRAEAHDANEGIQGRAWMMEMERHAMNRA